MQSSNILSLTIVGLAASSTAFTFYQSWGSPPSDSKSCSRGGPGDDLVDGHYFHLGTGCQTNGAGKDQSMKIKAGEGDSSLIAVFFSSSDCNPDTIIATVDETTELNGKEEGCFDGKYGSFDVWSVCEDDKLDCV